MRPCMAKGEPTPERAALVLELHITQSQHAVAVTGLIVAKVLLVLGHRTSNVDTQHDLLRDLALVTAHVQQAIRRYGCVRMVELGRWRRW